MLQWIIASVAVFYQESLSYESMQNLIYTFPTQLIHSIYNYMELNTIPHSYLNIIAIIVKCCVQSQPLTYL